RGLLLRHGLVDDAHDVGLLHDQEFLAVDLDLGAGPFAEQHAVADLDVDRDQLAGLVAAARADSGDLALRGLFLGGVRNDDAADSFLIGIDALDDDAVVKRAKFHGVLLKLLNKRWKLADGAASPGILRRTAWRPHKDLAFCPQGDAEDLLALLSQDCQQFLRWANYLR